jgi:hypothetical protein
MLLNGEGSLAGYGKMLHVALAALCQFLAQLPYDSVCASVLHAVSACLEQQLLCSSAGGYVKHITAYGYAVRCADRMT